MVTINPADKTKNYGQLLITSQADSLTGEDVLYRMQAIINVLKAVNLEMISNEDLYFLVSILEDYLPSPEQALKMVEVLQKTK